MRWPAGDPPGPRRLSPTDRHAQCSRHAEAAAVADGTAGGERGPGRLGAMDVDPASPPIRSRRSAPGGSDRRSRARDQQCPGTPAFFRWQLVDATPGRKSAGSRYEREGGPGAGRRRHRGRPGAPRPPWKKEMAVRGRSLLGSGHRHTFPALLPRPRPTPGFVDAGGTSHRLGAVPERSDARERRLPTRSLLPGQAVVVSGRGATSGPAGSAEER